MCLAGACSGARMRWRYGTAGEADGDGKGRERTRQMCGGKGRRRAGEEKWGIMEEIFLRTLTKLYSLKNKRHRYKVWVMRGAQPNMST